MRQRQVGFVFQFFNLVLTFPDRFSAPFQTGGATPLHFPAKGQRSERRLSTCPVRQVQGSEAYRNQASGLAYLTRLVSTLSWTVSTGYGSPLLSEPTLRPWATALGP